MYLYVRNNETLSQNSPLYAYFKIALWEANKRLISAQIFYPAEILLKLFFLYQFFTEYIF